MNVVYLGSKKIGYECLVHLITLNESKQINLKAVLTNERSLGEYDLKKLCAEKNIPLLETLDDIIDIESYDLLISVQYHEILKAQHINSARYLAVNYHMAPLPEYRGCNQFSFAIFDQAKVFGTTVHKLQVGIDAGDIIDEIRFPIQPQWDVKDLYDITYEKTLELFTHSILNIINGNINCINQNKLKAERGSKYISRKAIDALKQLSLDDDSDIFVRKIKATSMPNFVPPFFIYNGEKYYVIPEKNYKK